MDVDGLVVREGDRVTATGSLVRNDLGDWFQPALPIAEPGGLERRIRAAWKGAIRAAGAGFDAVAGRLEKDGAVAGWATVTGMWQPQVSNFGSSGRTPWFRSRRRTPGG